MGLRRIHVCLIWKYPVYLVLSSFLLNGCNPTRMDHSNPPLAQRLIDKGIDKSELSILIDKSDYTLSVIHNGTALKTYPVVFGGNPVDDKRMEGDGCTPEGVFSIRSLYPHQKWSKFMWIDYPTEESWSKHRTAKKLGAIPEEATIGGEVGIHGVPDNNSSLITNRINWTLGCISLTNADVDELYEVCFKGMRVEIRK